MKGNKIHSTQKWLVENGKRMPPTTEDENCATLGVLRDTVKSAAHKYVKATKGRQNIYLY